MVLSKPAPKSCKVTMADVGGSPVSNPQSPVNGILDDDPLTLDFDPMSFQLPSSPTESKGPPLDVDSSPEDPPFINDPSAVANDTNYKYNPKSYLLDLESIEKIKATAQVSSPADLASPESDSGPTPDLLVDLKEVPSPNEEDPEEDPEDSSSDAKTDSKELDLSAGSESTSSFVAECVSPSAQNGHSESDGSSPELDESAGLVKEVIESVGELAETCVHFTSFSPCEKPSTPDAGSPGKPSPAVASPVEEEFNPVLLTTSTPVDLLDKGAPNLYLEESYPPTSPERKSPSAVVSSPVRDQDAAVISEPADLVEDQVALPAESSSPPPSPPQSPHAVSTTEETDSTSTGCTYKLANLPVDSSLPKQCSPLQDISDFDLSSADTVTPPPMDPCRSPQKTQYDDLCEDNLDEGIAENVYTSTYTCMPDPDTPAGVAETATTLVSPVHENDTEEFDSCVSKVRREMKSKTSETSSHQMTSNKEGGKMIVEQKTATTCTVEEVTKHSAYDALNGLAHRHDKSNFTNNHSDVQTTPLEEVKVDKAKLQQKFDKIKPESTTSSTCRRCEGTVYPVERVKAEKNSYHKNCFRCKECNKLLSIDTYNSHESEIYCKVHFKQLFQPKVCFDNDGGPIPATPEPDETEEGRQRRHEMIIRENVPEELPPDVVRSDTKLDDGLGHLNVDLRNIRQQFETPQEFVPSVGDRSALARSESLVKRLEKYKCAISGDRNGTIDSSESEEDEDEEPSVHKERKAREKVVVFEGLSTLKSQWESGNVNNHQEEKEEVKEELAKLRKKMCLGRSESMRQVYQKAVEDANRTPVSARTEAVTLDGQEVKATDIKHKFEAGVVSQENEAEKIECLAREKEEELSVFSETGIAHEAKNIFKQIDAHVSKNATPPQLAPMARSPSNRWNQPKPQAPAAEIVRSSDPVNDVEVETTELSERFKFFENYQEESKERKRFQITPPREVREPSPEAPAAPNPNVVRAVDAVEDVIVTDTARRMRERFREMESQAGKQEVPAGPKPLKRITPPREYTVEDREESPDVQRDPTVVQCSYKVDDDIVVEADRAKSMRARFENWEAQVAQENRKNGVAEDDEEECLPMADTAKNLRAKFEAIKEESARQEAERRKARVNRFVELPGTPVSDTCSICSKKLYPMERMEASGLRLHKNCFLCSHCSCHLRLENYTVRGGKLFCTPHFRQFFIAKGNYDEGFGLEKWSRSTSPASRESSGDDYANATNNRLNGLDQPITA
ncbi:uncharacterized protein LOC135390920 isoform X7 [Ornithodoros turicata]|uniref:uncharacterized protein LOC135390920 isoform X7 n=1 Tax=Ornithodoros turicata TaxID=34597 RepID=UPI003138798C